MSSYLNAVAKQASLERQLAAAADVASDEGAGLSGISADLEAEVAPLVLRVSEVKKCEGSASVLSSRGKTKHCFDFGFELEWEATLQPLQPGAADGEGQSESKSKAKKACKGVLTYAEVTSPAAGPDSYEVASKFKKAPAAKLQGRAAEGVALLRAEVAKVVDEFAAELRQKSV